MKGLMNNVAIYIERWNKFAYGWYLRVAGQHLARDELNVWHD